MNNEKLKIAICGYLPYGVKAWHSNHENGLTLTLEHQTYTSTNVGFLVVLKHSEYWKPLLFPIQSLTKEIQLSDYNNGEPFVPIVILRDFMEDQIPDLWFNVKSIDAERCKRFPLEVIDLLNRWKIDYRGLIAEGLAIEINESNNPYL